MTQVSKKSPRRMATSPTENSLKYLRKQGYTVAVVEHWNPHARIRQDLFGFVDLLAIRGSETLAVQSTSWANTASRVGKIAEHENVGFVRDAGWAIHVHGWRKNPKTNRYELKVVDVS